MPVASDIMLALSLMGGGGERDETESRTFGYQLGKCLPAHAVRHCDLMSCCAVARFRKRTSTQSMCVYPTVCYASQRVMFILITGFIGWLKLH